MASILFLDSHPRLLTVGLPGPLHRPAPDERFDPARSAFGEFLRANAAPDALLIAVGRADFLTKGDPLRVVRDHVNITGANPLLGAGREGEGPRFPSQHAVWRPEAAGGIQSCVAAAAQPLQFVTSAELDFLKRSDLDALSEDVILEAILANFYSIPTVGLLIPREHECAEKEIAHCIGNILKKVN